MRSKRSIERADEAPKYLSRIGQTGMAAFLLGTMSVIACELPLILAVIGLGGLASIVPALPLPVILESIAIGSGIAGLLAFFGCRYLPNLPKG